MSTQTLAPPTRRIALLRSGLVLATLLALADLVTGLMALFGAFFAPPEIGAVMVALGAVTVALVPVAWSSRRGWAAWTIVAARLLSASTGLPAFFVPGVPAAAITTAAIGVILAVAVAVLVAFGVGSRR